MKTRIVHRAMLLSALLLTAMVAGPAQAALMLSPGDEVATSNDTSNLNVSEVEAILIGAGYTDPLNLAELYKSNVSGGDGIGSDEKAYADYYRTTFSNSASDPADALIEYLGGSSILCPDCFLLVKDGNQQPAQYIFDISSWDGITDISLTGFWPQRGAISHVSIYGNGRGNEIPLPGTALLFGMGLFLLGMSARRSR